MLVLSPVKKEIVGLVGSRMSTRLQKQEDRVHGSAMKKIEECCYSEIFFS
jgi:hypothetical protein